MSLNFRAFEMGMGVIPLHLARLNKVPKLLMILILTFGSIPVFAAPDMKLLDSVVGALNSGAMLPAKPETQKLPDGMGIMAKVEGEGAWRARTKGDVYDSFTMCYGPGQCVTATTARCEKAREMIDVDKNLSIFEMAQLLKNCNKASRTMLSLDEGAVAASKENINALKKFQAPGSTFSEVPVNAAEYLLYFALACERLFVTTVGVDTKKDPGH